jgi:hypothetical protein
LATFITPRIAPISPSDTRHSFHVGRTLSDALRLLAKNWIAIVVAFAVLRMMPRVIFGEDMDAGLLGDNRSLIWDMLTPLGDIWSGFAARQVMEVPDYLFEAVATVILLRDGTRPKWFGLLPALTLSILFFIFVMLADAQPLLFNWPAPVSVLLYLLLIILILATALSGPAAADELRGPVPALWRSVQLVAKGPFRLIVLLLIIAALIWLSQAAERLLLTAIPVTDGNWFDWLTTMFQEIISGFYLPFEVAILVVAFLHLRRRHDGDKPEDTAAIFD